MDFLINLLGLVNFFLTVAWLVALWERYEARHFPSEADRQAERERKRHIMASWRR